MAKLIAPTLLNSFDWLMQCPQSWKESAYESIRTTLTRAEWTPSDAIKKGMDFEDNVYRVCKQTSEAGLKDVQASKHFLEVCKIVHGGTFQKVSKSFIEVDGIEYCLYGRIDVYFDDLIIDLKTTGKFKGKQQYDKGWQPSVYCYNEGISDFMFLVIEWKSKTDFRVKDIHRVWLCLNAKKQLEDAIVKKIREFRAFLKDNKPLENAYNTIYNKYDKG